MSKLDLFIEEIKSKIPSDNKLIQNGPLKNTSRRGRDRDTYEYNEIDKDGNIIAIYIIEDSMSIYPPFDRDVVLCEKKLVTK